MKCDNHTIVQSRVRSNKGQEQSVRMYGILWYECIGWMGGKNVDCKRRNKTTNEKADDEELSSVFRLCDILDFKEGNARGQEAEAKSRALRLTTPPDFLPGSAFSRHPWDGHEKGHNQGLRNSQSTV